MNGIKKTRLILPSLNHPSKTTHTVVFKLSKTYINTVWRQKKRPKVNECSSVTNYRTAMIFFCKIASIRKFFLTVIFFVRSLSVYLFLPFSPLEGPKRAKKHPQVDKIAILGMKRYSSTPQTL